MKILKTVIFIYEFPLFRTEKIRFQRLNSIYFQITTLFDTFVLTFFERFVTVNKSYETNVFTGILERELLQVLQNKLDKSC